MSYNTLSEESGVPAKQMGRLRIIEKYPSPLSPSGGELRILKEVACSPDDAILFVLEDIFETCTVEAAAIILRQWFAQCGYDDDYVANIIKATLDDEGYTTIYRWISDEIE